MVLQYVRSNFVTGKIGVHGQSIGGMVSLYVAKKCKVDFVFSDRTFASLDRMAYWLAGKKSKVSCCSQLVYKVFKTFTLNWNDNGL